MLALGPTLMRFRIGERGEFLGEREPPLVLSRPMTSCALDGAFIRQEQGKVVLSRYTYSSLQCVQQVDFVSSGDPMIFIGREGHMHEPKRGAG